MPYELEFRPEAIEDLRRLEKVIAQRILKKLKWFAENFEHITPEPLRWEMKGLFKLRIGDYRIIYSIVTDEQKLIIYLIGHRKEIYKNL